MAKLIRIVVYSFLALLILGVTGPLVLNHFIQAEKIKPDLEKGLSDYLQRKLTIRNLAWNLFPHPALIGTDVVLFERDGSQILEAPRIYARLDLRHLLSRQVYIRVLRILRPSMVFRRTNQGTNNLASVYRDIWNQMNQPSVNPGPQVSFFLRKIIFDKANIKFIDENLNEKPFQAKINGTATFDIPPGAEPVTMNLEAEVTRDQKRGFITAKGPVGEKTRIDLRLQEIPIKVFSEYAPALSNLNGRLGLKGQVDSSSGTISWNLRGDVKRITPVAAGTFPEMSAQFLLRSGRPTIIGTIQLAGGDNTGQIAFVYPLGKTKNALSVSIKNFSFDDVKLDGVEAQVERGPQNWWIAQATIPFAQCRGETFRNAVVRGEYGDGVLNVSRAEAIFMGGKMEGSGQFKSPAPSSGTAAGEPRQEFLSRFNVSWKLTGIEASALGTALGKDFKIRGLAFSQGTLSGNRNKFVSNELNGFFSLTLSKGVIGNRPGVVKFLTSFNIKSLLEKMEGRKVKGLPYNVAMGTFSIQNGILKTEGPAHLEGDTMELNLKGTVNLLENTIKADAVVQFLTPVDETFNLIPGAKIILMGGEKTFLPLWANVSGPLNDPDVSIQTSKSIGKKAWNTVIGIFKFPADLLKSITGSK